MVVFSRRFLLLACSLLPSFCYSEPNNYEESTAEIALADANKTSVNEDVQYVKRYKRQCSRVTRRMCYTDHIPTERLIPASPHYMEGYIQALVDLNFFELAVVVHVPKDGEVVVYNLPSNARIRLSILSLIESIPEVQCVYEADLTPQVEKQIRETSYRTRIQGVWFPETTLLFEPPLANVQKPQYSLGYRGGDRTLGKSLITISLGDFFPIFRWFDVCGTGGDLQIDIGAGVWGVFNMEPRNCPDGQWAELVNTDYLFSIPLSYAIDRWSFRARIYHISTHLGDEFICNHPRFVCDRVNPSYEALEFLAAYLLHDSVRFFGGPGFILNSDDSYPMGHFYLEYGVEWYVWFLNSSFHRTYMSPYFAVDVQQWDIKDMSPSLTMQLGLQWSKRLNEGRKVRLFAEYHNGYSDGQFFLCRSAYWALRITWGF